MQKPINPKTAAYLTVYRFMYPQHFDYLMSQGMGIRWMPDWAINFNLMRRA